ncbi:Phage regulatory protein Rha [compost metagenome]
MNAMINGSPAVTMTSQEIADLVESRHDSVKRTIERLANQGVITLPPLVEVSNPGPGPKMIAVHQFSGEKGKRDSIIVVAQLSPEFTARLVDRWQALEAGAAPPRALSPAEMLLAQAQLMVDQQRRLEQNEQAVSQVRQQMGQLAESRVWDHCPQNCEPITKIRARMNQRYGLPAWVVDTVMRGLPLSLKVHGMVRNNHESAEGSHYEVWAVADVTRVFKQFVAECKQETAWFATHPMIEDRFKLRHTEGVEA